MNVACQYARGVRGSVELGLAFGVSAANSGTVDLIVMTEMISNNGSHKDMETQAWSTRSGAAGLRCTFRPRVL